jgi:hypothetical protein
LCLDIRRPKGSRASDLSDSASGTSEDSAVVGNGDGGIRVTDVVTVDLPPISRENVKVICIDVFRTLVVSYIIDFYHILFLIMISIS